MSRAPGSQRAYSWLFDDSGRARDHWLEWIKLEQAVRGPGQMRSYALDFASPAAASARATEPVWPFDLTTGAIDRATWTHWNRHSPSQLLERPPILAAARANLDGRLFIAVARNDQFDLFAPAVRFHEQLDRLGVRHEFRIDDSGHFRGATQRLTAGFALVVDTLADEAPVKKAR